MKCLHFVLKVKQIKLKLFYSCKMDLNVENLSFCYVVYFRMINAYIAFISIGYLN